MLPNISNKQRDLPLSISSVRSVIREVLCLKKIKTDEISVYFVCERKISKLHKEFFNDPTSTDCISLPLDEYSRKERHHILGEIFICPGRAKHYIAKRGGNIYEEVTLYLVHSLLHLLGYGDLSLSDRKKMRWQEKRIMNHLIKKSILIHSKY